MKLLRSVILVSLCILPVYSAQNTGDGIELPVIPKAIEEKTDVNSCVYCHQNLEGRTGATVEEWKTSVHAEVGSKCQTCHGGNPNEFDREEAKSSKHHFIGRPDKKQIVAFCGRGGCHSTELAHFKRGPHYKTVLQVNEPNCTTCHGVHDIQRSSIDILKSENCTQCHNSSYAEEIIEAIGSVEKGIDQVDANIQFLGTQHANIESIQQRLEKTRSLFNELVHVFSKEDIKSTKKIVELEIQNLQTESQSKVALSKRLDLLYYIMLILGLAMILSFSVYTVYMYSQRR